MKINGKQVPREPNEYDKPNDVITEWLVEHAEAVRVVNSQRGHTIFVRGMGFAPSKNQGDVAPGHTKGRDVYVSIICTKRQALKHLNMDYTEKMRAECFVRLTVSNRCMWIG